jgi:transcriptional regulator with XRE-family HTH domain
MRETKVEEWLGRKIRLLRTSKNLTQQELGATCGINYKHLGSIERGEENPSLSILQKIAEGLGVEIVDLFRFHREDQETDSTKLKKMIIDLVKDEKVERLQLILRIINAIK